MLAFLKCTVWWHVAQCPRRATITMSCSRTLSSGRWKPRPQEALAALALVPAICPLSLGLPALGPSTHEACASRLSRQPCVGTEARSRQGRPCGRVVVRCVGGHFVYVLACGWPFGWFLPLVSSEQRHCEHSCPGFCLNTCFCFWHDSREWNFGDRGWALWQQRWREGG